MRFWLHQIFHDTHCIMPKWVTHRQYPHICEEQHSSFWRNVAVVQAVGNTVSDLTSQKYEPPNPGQMCYGEFTQYPFFVRFFTFLLLLDKVCAFSSAFLCVHICTNQTVTYWTKVFRKIFFVKGYSSISKYRSYCSYTKFLNKIFIYI